MSCRQQFTHLLYDLAANRLDSEAREAVEAHLADCPDCAREMVAMRKMNISMQQLEKATRYNISDQAARHLLKQARPRLTKLQTSKAARAAKSLSLSQYKDQVRRVARRKQWSRMLVPVAAAVLLVIGLQLLPMIVDKSPQSAGSMQQLSARAGSVATVADLHALEPLARSAIDETMAGGNVDVDRLANLQLVHYIAANAVEEQQISDLQFLLNMTSNRATTAAAAGLVDQQRDIVDLLSDLFERQAMAVVAVDNEALQQARDEIAAGQYEAAFETLAGSNLHEGEPLAVYAAIHAGWSETARELLDAMTATGRADRHLVDLLHAELSLAGKSYDMAIESFGRAATRERNRLWFQAGYLVKYEQKDDVLAGQMFQRMSDRLLTQHVQQRFGMAIAMSRQSRPLFREDFQGHAIGGVPQSWKLIPAHEKEYAIAEMDGSKVLLVSQSGFPRGRLSFGHEGHSNYTFTCDFKILKTDPDAEIDITVYDVGLRHYALRLDGRQTHLAHRRLGGRSQADGQAADGVSADLQQDLADGQWWRATIEVRTLDKQRTQISARLWPRNSEMPQQWQMQWTHQTEPPQQALQHGFVGLHVMGADLAVDNIVINAIPGAAPSIE